MKMSMKDRARAEAGLGQTTVGAGQAKGKRAGLLGCWGQPPGSGLARMLRKSQGKI